MSHFDLTARRYKIQELTAKTLEESFWNDPQKAQVVIRQLNAIKDVVDSYDALQKALSSLDETQEPVSYTHLMVELFQRPHGYPLIEPQVYQMPKAAQMVWMLCFLRKQKHDGIQTLVFVPVSYTHLYTIQQMPVKALVPLLMQISNMNVTFPELPHGHPGIFK